MPKFTYLKTFHTTTRLSNAVYENLFENAPIPEDLVNAVELVACSNHKAFQFIKDHPNYPYSYENSAGINQGDVKTHLIQQYFPEGMPKQFSQLSYAQKEIIAMADAHSLAVGMGIIPQTYSDNVYFTQNQDNFFKTFDTTEAEYINPAKLENQVKINRAREFLSLENSICTMDKLNATQLVHSGGLAHMYEDINCFPGVEIEVIDFSCLDRAILTEQERKEEKQYIHKVKKYRAENPINCKEMEETFAKMSPPVTRCQLPSYVLSARANNSLFANNGAVQLSQLPTTLTDSNQISAIVAGSITLLATLGCMLFSRTRAKKHNESIETEAKSNKSKTTKHRKK
jgi:hypothetical protein